MDAIEIREIVGQALVEQGAKRATEPAGAWPGDDASAYLIVRTPDGRTFKINIEEI